MHLSGSLCPYLSFCHSEKKVLEIPITIWCQITSLDYIPEKAWIKILIFFRQVHDHLLWDFYTNTLDGFPRDVYILTKMARETSTLFYIIFPVQYYDSLLRRGSTFRLNPLCEVCACRRKVDWIDQKPFALSLCAGQRYYDTFLSLN